MVSAKPLLGTNLLSPSWCSQGTGTSWSATLCGGDWSSITTTTTAALQPRRFVSGGPQPTAGEEGPSLPDLRYVCLGKDQIFPLFNDLWSQMQQGSGSFLHCDNSASASASAPWGVFNQCNLGQELSVLANQKGIGVGWQACDYTDDDTIFVTVSCSAEPSSYLPLQLQFGGTKYLLQLSGLHFGDQMLSPFIGVERLQAVEQCSKLLFAMEDQSFWVLPLILNPRTGDF